MRPQTRFSDSIHIVSSEVLVTPSGIAPGVDEALDRGRGALGDHVAAGDRARGVRHPGDRERLLDRAGHAEQRRRVLAPAARAEQLVGRVGLGASLVEAGRRRRR